MTIFFTMLFILLSANAVFMLFGMNGANQKDIKMNEEETESAASKVYPIDMGSTEFKKAV